MTKKLSNLTERITSLMLIFSLLFAFSPFTASANDEIKVLLDGIPIKFDVPPQIIDGRTMVPIRAIFEAMGAEVTWDDEKKAAVAKKGDITVTMRVNSSQFMMTNKISNKVEFMDVSPVNKDGRVLAPARYVAESFYYDVEWDSIKNIVRITSEDITNPFKTFYNAIQANEPKKLSNEVYSLEHISTGKSNSYVNILYDTSNDKITFRLEYDNYSFTPSKSITVEAYLYPESDNVDIFFLLFPINIGGYGSINKRLFNTTTTNSINIEYRESSYAPKGDVYAECIKINIESLKLMLRAVEGFLIYNTSLRLKDFGFESFDAYSVSPATQEGKMLSLFDEITKKNSTTSNTSTNNTSTSNDTYYVYKGTSVPCYDDISGDNYLGDYEGYRVYSYSNNGLKKYLSFLKELGYKQDGETYHNGNFHHYTYYDSEYAIFIINTILYIKGIRTDVIELKYMPNLRD